MNIFVQPVYFFLLSIISFLILLQNMLYASGYVVSTYAFAPTDGVLRYRVKSLRKRVAVLVQSIQFYLASGVEVRCYCLSFAACTNLAASIVEHFVKRSCFRLRVTLYFMGFFLLFT